EMLDLMAKMYFDTHRLGIINENVERAEPVVRNADLVSIDVASVRHSDAPGTAKTGPNGLYGEQLCQIARYIGMSDKMSAVGFFEYNPTLDRQEITAQLIAQSIWCLIEAVAHRKKDYPVGDKDDYLKYIVDIPDSKDSITFFKSPRSDRWWMDVPYPAGMRNKYHRHHLVPCTYEDYQRATNEDIPDLWWRTYQKLT
ncbi:MAG: arginase, partial [Flavobacteriales bacterium]|nr:arginase [Flavobacteriales bacterium]